MINYNLTEISSNEYYEYQSKIFSFCFLYTKEKDSWILNPCQAGHKKHSSSLRIRRGTLLCRSFLENTICIIFNYAIGVFPPKCNIPWSSDTTMRVFIKIWPFKRISIFEFVQFLESYWVGKTQILTRSLKITFRNNFGYVLKSSQKSEQNPGCVLLSCILL